MEVKVNFDGIEPNIVVVSGLKNVRKILKGIKVDSSRYNFVEVMAMPRRLCRRRQTARS
jgi:NADH-quinone oxidoreductase subunit G